MQEAEADMARDKGVPVIQLRMDEETCNFGPLYYGDHTEGLEVAARQMRIAPTAKKHMEQQGSGWKLPAGHEWAPAEVQFGQRVHRPPTPSTPSSSRSSG